ncbi:hypothetical protein [Methanoregula sp.]|jgi:hypothetical protein|uniref:hypothetical protein n=1 Tax=Methanoregula sp. TaxID=2052170 RepID=UPI0025D912D1|nr:hypothetical protein [Methanoregula sp.]
MNKYLLALLLSSLILVGSASAYGMYLNCSPTSIPVGQTLKCAVDSDFPPGTSFNLVFYQSQYTSTEIDRQAMTIQTDQSTQYALFDTTGLKGGQYKVEIQFNGVEPSMRSDSVSSLLITLTDRSNELTITSPTTQNLAGALLIAGSLKKGGNAGIQIQVDGESAGRVYGPRYIGTVNNLQSGDGFFSQTISVTQPDDYKVYFSDANGAIATITFHVVAPTTVTTVVPTVTTIKKVTTVKTATFTPIPTPTKSSMPAVVVIGALGIAMLVAVRIKKDRK